MRSQKAPYGHSALESRACARLRARAFRVVGLAYTRRLRRGQAGRAWRQTSADRPLAEARGDGLGAVSR